MRATVDCEPGQAERLAEVLEWLFVVFEKRLGLPQILAAVRDSYLTLKIDEEPAAMRRLERVAFDHLDALVTSQRAGTRCARVIPGPFERSNGDAN